MADLGGPDSVPLANGSLSNPFDAAAGRAQGSAGTSLVTFFASLIGASSFFGLEIGIFLLIKGRFPRIYQPRTFLVPERERTKAPPRGFWQWLIPVFQTSNSEFIEKCGLDAYFFLRYLRTLLKIFVPLSFVILPILLPINAVHGRGPGFAVGIYSRNNTLYSNVTGLDQLAWGNVRPEKNGRYWAHLSLAVLVVVYCCYIFYDELRGFIRLRQAYLTSPQHRLRASATTVLVSGIPRKWCTFEALNGLYDVFPGGIRNIWINRNYDELSEKVKVRNDIATKLESAETELIKNVKKVHLKMLAAEAKKAKTKLPHETKTDSPKGTKPQHQKVGDDQGAAMADSPGVSSGDPHQVHTLDDALFGPSDQPSTDSPDQPSTDLSPGPKRLRIVRPMRKESAGAVGHGVDEAGKPVFKGLEQIRKNVHDRLNTTEKAVYDRRIGENGDDVASTGLGIENSDIEKTHDSHDASHDESFYQGDMNDSATLGSLEKSEHSEHPSQIEQHHFGADGWYEDSRIDQRLARGNNTGEPHGAEKQKKSGVKFWKLHRGDPFGIPSPTPHGKEEDEFPLSKPSPIIPETDAQASVQKETLADSAVTRSSNRTKISIGRKKSNKKTRYPCAYNENYDPYDDGEPLWKAFLKEKDRETMRLPIFDWGWMPSLPLIGEKVDTIDHCRKELARLNVEIEQDQREPEKFPLMNSAFIQFNNQVAAHMACQSVSHHTPNSMTPRLIEISPDDVIWDNMSIKWWESYIRIGVVLILIAGLVVGWAFPVTFTGLLSQIDYLTTTYTWLAWLNKAPTWVLSIIQGLLPQILLGALLAVLPLVLRFLAKTQGNRTGMQVELSVQNYFFAFLFVQVFLVVSISSGLTTVIDKISKGPQSVPSILAGNLPKASNYFFSYLLLQALTVSAGALVQLDSLFGWFVMAPIRDQTARQKWARQTNLPEVRWGTFFPVYTNLAAIGLIYSVISPLIMVFNIITFGLFWMVHRYNTLYVTKFRFDTGGLLYPKAINQLFTGLYVMELCLIGLFFLVRDADDAGRAVGTPCKGQAIIMIIVLMLTAIFQFLLNRAFGPLFKYLPITLEDEAVIRDEEFAKKQQKRWKLDQNEHEGDDINDVLAERARRSKEESRKAEDMELKQIQARKEQAKIDPKNIISILPGPIKNFKPKRVTWADRPPNQEAHNSTMPEDDEKPLRSHHREKQSTDPEAQNSRTASISNRLFSGIKDEIQDLSPDERDKLVRRAFQHDALRAKRPVIWIPQDETGVSDDEVFRTQKVSKHVWISNDYVALDWKCRVVYRRGPPDFSDVDLIEL